MMGSLFDELHIKILKSSPEDIASIREWIKVIDVLREEDNLSNVTFTQNNPLVLKAIVSSLRKDMFDAKVDWTIDSDISSEKSSFLEDYILNEVNLARIVNVPPSHVKDLAQSFLEQGFKKGIFSPNTLVSCSGFKKDKVPLVAVALCGSSSQLPFLWEKAMEKKEDLDLDVLAEALVLFSSFDRNIINPHFFSYIEEVVLDLAILSTNDPNLSSSTQECIITTLSKILSSEKNKDAPLSPKALNFCSLLSTDPQGRSLLSRNVKNKGAVRLFFEVVNVAPPDVCNALLEETLIAYEKSSKEKKPKPHGFLYTHPAMQFSESQFLRYMKTECLAWKDLAPTDLLKKFIQPQLQNKEVITLFPPSQKQEWFEWLKKLALSCEGAINAQSEIAGNRGYVSSLKREKLEEERKRHLSAIKMLLEFSWEKPRSSIRKKI